jgi:predicted DNA-binding transcriptional regulator AlpA
MKFLVQRQLGPDKGITYSDRQLKRLEAKGLFPKRVPLAGGCLKGWPEVVIDEHLESLARKSRAFTEAAQRQAAPEYRVVATNRNGGPAKTAASNFKGSERYE